MDAGLHHRRISYARIRLLEVADELFYREGIVATGVDRIIAVAQVTKATFYKQYGSKDTLILEYVEGRDRQVRASLDALLEQGAATFEVLAAVVDAVAADIARPDFRGDPFVNAAAEFASASHPVRLAINEHRDWVTGWLEDRFRDLGHPVPGAAADEFVLMRDGALAGAYAGDTIAATSAFARAAMRLVTAATAAER